MRMTVRWTLAVLAVAALAVATIRTQMPWLGRPETAMVKTGAGAAGDARDEPVLSCPADAKAANLGFTMKDASGKDVTLSDYQGKVIMIDFWATWCAPCKVEIPHFVEFQERYGPKGLQILGISVDDTSEQLAPYIRDMKMNYPVLVGQGRDDVQEAFGPILGVPVSVMISRDGKICATHTGLTEKDVFEREIQALL
jgi:thiol-disulfide isomerase/thioredoxin